MDKRDQSWQDCLSCLDIRTGILLHQSEYDAYRRVYLANGNIYKVVASKHQSTGALRAQSLAGEYAILRRCADVKGIPSALAYQKTGEYEALVESRMAGVRAADLEIGWRQLLSILGRLSIILVRLSWRGVSHNDIFLHNVLVGPGGSVCLVDFDQATRTNFFGGLLRQFAGIGISGGKVHGSLVTVLKLHVKDKLSPRTRKFLKKLRDTVIRSNADSVEALADDPNTELKA